jgi:hypothetical protein
MTIQYTSPTVHDVAAKEDQPKHQSRSQKQIRREEHVSHDNSYTVNDSRPLSYCPFANIR